MRDDAPIMSPYARHVFVCAGQYCDPDGKATAVYRRLAEKLGALGDYTNPYRVKRGLTPCLGVCIGGPILVVYPEGIWYHHVDDDAVVDRIVQEHFKEGRPVEDYIFHRLEDNPVCASRHHGEVPGDE
ncbi:MAG: (2Fe-2S) ferredoxin domain-containing protein [Caldilineaceae bacterium]|nr:(2Fe-2S) ferredoxin domain-containing protein [Caldilineaceae bacterium]